MDLKLADRVIVVSGGATQTGAAVVTALADKGAIPFILDDRPPGDAVLARTAAPSLVVTLEEATECADALERIVTRFGRVDGLVNVADRESAHASPVHGSAFTAASRGLTAAFLIAHHCVPFLRSARGAIVNLAVDESGNRRGGRYSRLEAAVSALTKDWATGLASDGIRVNAVIGDGPRSEWPRPRARPQGELPVGLLDTPIKCEVSDCVPFLLSECASHINGQLFRIGQPSARSYGPR